MKKTLLSIIVLTLISTAPISARDYKTLSFGVKAGVNLASVTGLEELVGGARPDFTGGLFLEFRPVKIVGVSIEALYSGDGFKTEPVQIDNWTGTLDASLGYIAVPIMAKIYVAGGFSINVGVQPSFLVHYKLNFNDDNATIFAFEPVTFSIPVGLSYSFGFGLVVDARYNIAVTDTNKPLNGTTSIHTDDFGIKNASFALSVGWRF